MCSRGYDNSFKLQHSHLLRPLAQHWQLCWRCLGTWLVVLVSWHMVMIIALDASVFVECFSFECLSNVVDSLINIWTNYIMFLFLQGIWLHKWRCSIFPMLASMQRNLPIVKYQPSGFLCDLMWCYAILLQNVYGLAFLALVPRSLLFSSIFSSSRNDSSAYKFCRRYFLLDKLRRYVYSQVLRFKDGYLLSW
jgi:hypothetical protein